MHAAAAAVAAPAGSGGAGMGQLVGGQDAVGVGVGVGATDGGGLVSAMTGVPSHFTGLDASLGEAPEAMDLGWQFMSDLRTYL